MSFSFARTSGSDDIFVFLPPVLDLGSLWQAIPFVLDSF